MSSILSLGKKLVPRKLYEKLQFERYPIQDFLRRHALPQMKPGLRVLDAGSGRMPEQDMRAEYLETGATLETLDLFEGEGVDHAGDLHDTKLPSEDYDQILCVQVMEHVHTPQKVLSELHRMLKPEGELWLTAPQSCWMHNLPYHFFNYTRIGLEKLLDDAGFEVLKVEPQGGHFIMLGMQLHFTSSVMLLRGERTGHKWFWGFMSLLCRIFLGFFAKVMCLMLDKLDRHDENTLNTQGWNFYCKKKKPGEEAKPEEKQSVEDQAGDS